MVDVELDLRRQITELTAENEKLKAELEAATGGKPVEVPGEPITETKTRRK